MRQWTVDAFAAAPFRGNPACVVEPFDHWPSDGWMQALAKENNQAETAFLLRTADPARFGLRWFTPGREVDLCGHATLGSAHVLMAELGVEPVEVWAGRYLVAILADAETVRTLRPDIPALAALQGEAGEAGEVIVCADADPGDDVDVVDRFFAPGCGVDEDPATGSAHCILGPLYADRLGRPDVRFRQAFPGRGGDIGTEVRGDRVLLRGRAVTVIESRLRLAP